jgi:hypothetical protein
VADYVLCLETGGCPTACETDADCEDADYYTTEWCEANGYCANNGCPYDFFYSPTLKRCKCSSSPPTNVNDSGGVNLADWALMADCLTGPGSAMVQECDCGDGDHDDDVDLRDAQQTQHYFRP